MSTPIAICSLITSSLALAACDPSIDPSISEIDVESEALDLGTSTGSRFAACSLAPRQVGAHERTGWSGTWGSEDGTVRVDFTATQYGLVAATVHESWLDVTFVGTQATPQRVTLPAYGGERWIAAGGFPLSDSNAAPLDPACRVLVARDAPGGEAVDAIPLGTIAGVVDGWLALYSEESLGTPVASQRRRLRYVRHDGRPAYDVLLMPVPASSPAKVTDGVLGCTGC